MEWLRKKRTQEKEDIGIQASFVVQRQLKEGHEISKKSGLNHILQLSGNDETLLHLLVGLRSLNAKIDGSELKLRGKPKILDEIFIVHKRTPATRMYLQRAEEVNDYINEYIDENYTLELNKARSIQLAVAVLFAPGKNASWNKESITNWANEWKEKIHSTAHPFPRQ